MSDFNVLCKEFEKLDPNLYSVILAEKSSTILPRLVLLSSDGISGSEIFFSFIIASVSSDGKLSEEEFELVRPLVFSFFGSDINFEEAKSLFKEYKKDSKEVLKITNEMVDILGEVDEDLKDDIILVCMMICSIDGKISFKERKWLKTLIK